MHACSTCSHLLIVEGDFQLFPLPIVVGEERHFEKTHVKVAALGRHGTLDYRVVEVTDNGDAAVEHTRLIGCAVHDQVTIEADSEHQLLLIR